MSLTLPKQRREHIARGILLRISAVTSLSLMAAILKMAAERGVVAPEMLFYRAAFGLPVVLFWVLAGQGLSALATRRPLAHAGRAMLGISTILCTYQALVLLPLADATTIGFTAPIFATLLSWVILRERVSRHRWLAVVAGFLGVWVLVQPNASEQDVTVTGAMFALISAIGTAGVTITLRHLGSTEHVAAIVFWHFISSILVELALLPAFGRIHDASTLLLLVLAGVAGGLGQILMTASLQSAPVAVLSPFDYLQIVGVVIFGWLMLSSTPTTATMAGAALITGSGLYTGWREHRQRRT